MAETPRHPPAPLSWDAHTTITEVGSGVAPLEVGAFLLSSARAVSLQRRACRARAISFCLPSYPGVSATLLCQGSQQPLGFPVLTAAR